MKVIFMGKDKPSTSECLRYLVDQGIEVIAVVGSKPGNRPFFGERLDDVAQALALPVATDNEIYEQLSGGPKKFDLTNIDLVISFLFWRRIRQPLIDLPRIGCINFHPAPLPEFRGLWGYNAAIYEQLPQWGVTAHHVVESFDTGDIIQSRRFPINPENETAHSLEKRSMVEMVALFKDVIATARTKGTLDRTPQGEGRYINMAEFNEVRRVTGADSPEEIERKIRAFWFPPQHGAFIEIGGREYTLVSEELLKTEVLSMYDNSGGSDSSSTPKVEVVGIGAGGHSRVVMENVRCAGEYRIIGLLDDDPNLAGQIVADASVLGTLKELPELHRKNVHHVFIGVGYAGDNSVRARLFNQAQKLGFTIVQAIHPRATIAASASIGEGTVIMAGAVVNPGAKIGNNVIINTGAVIDHDCQIGDHVHIAPGVTLSGNVVIGEGSHVGTGACVKQGTKIGSNTIIGVGAAVVGDLPDNVVAVGVPARVLRANPAVLES